MNIGIDLGTTNTIVGWMNIFGNIEFLKFEGDSIILPSCICYDRGKMLVGSPALEAAKSNPAGFISTSKIFMDDKIKSWDIDGKRFKAEDVAFEILKKVKNTLSEKFPDVKKFKAVVTVPAKFGEDQIKRTAAAVKRAGISLIEILKEPVAAVLAYNDDNFKAGEKVYVIDIGGGTMDVALIELEGNNGVTGFNVLAADGIRHLGGNDFDGRISKIIFEQFRSCSGQNLTDSSTVWGASRKQIKHKIEKISEYVKKELYQKNSDVTINADEVCSICEKKNVCQSDCKFQLDLSFNEYLSACDDLYKWVKELISNDSINEYNIDHILFVGGMSNDPYIRQYIEDTYSDSDVICAADMIDNEKYLTAIARGAAIKACDENIHVVNKLLNSLGIICRNEKGKMYMDTIIAAGADIDENFETHHTYTNNGRFETEMRFEIYEYSGDPNDFSNISYRKIGEFIFNDIIPMDRGEQRIETIFRFDKKGIMTVSAEDLNDHNRSVEVSFEV